MSEQPGCRIACTAYIILIYPRLADFADLKQSFGSADYVPPYTVFDVGGNNYRVVVIVRYRDGKMFVRWGMTHREYDNWCKLYRKGKV
jgi:mRNA interferase HigB